MTKAYTDLEQSKKLAKILPIKSADNVIVSFGDREGTKTVVMPNKTLNIIRNPFSDIRETVNCWSLAALLSVLPKGEYKDIDLCYGGYQGDKYIPEWFCSYEQQEPFVIEVCHADNPVDACYDMVMRLNELNLL